VIDIRITHVPIRIQDVHGYIFISRKNKSFKIKNYVYVISMRKYLELDVSDVNFIYVYRCAGACQITFGYTGVGKNSLAQLNADEWSGMTAAGIVSP
jgi:hypothetical protein